MKSFVLFLVFLAVCVAGHHRGLNAPMLYDSRLWIEGKAHVFESRNLMDVIAIVPKRPLFMASLHINHVLTGMEPAAFRLFNAAVAAASGVALVWSIVLLLRIGRPDPRRTRAEELFIAVPLGMLFVVHPLQTFVVLYIWQREAILACFFFFAALATYLAVRSGRIEYPWIGYLATSLLFFAGLNSKENVVSLPVMLFAAEALFFVHMPPAGLEREQTPEESRSEAPTPGLFKHPILNESAKRLLLIGLITVPPLVVYLVTTHYLHGGESVHDQGVRDRLLGYYEMSGITFFQVVGTECRVLFSYLTMIVAPFIRPLSLIEAQTVSSSLWNPPATLPAVLGVLGLLAAIPILAKKRPLSAFGILFFLVGSAPEALLIPQYLYFGYRAILPMAGVLMVLADGVSFLLQSARTSRWLTVLRPALILFMVTISICFATLTVSQAGKWTPHAFWTQAYSHLPPPSENVEKVPYVTVLVNLAATRADFGEYREAAELLRRARRIYPEAPTITLNLGNVLIKAGATDEAHTVLEALVRERPEMAEGWIALSRTLRDQGKTDEAIACLREAVRKYPKDSSLRLRLAEALADSGKAAESSSLLKTILAADPHNTAAIVQMAFAARKSGNLQQAVRLYKRALETSPGSREALMGLLVAERELAAAGRRPKGSIEQVNPTEK